jgi:hypothetical protein
MLRTRNIPHTEEKSTISNAEHSFSMLSVLVLDDEIAVLETLCTMVKS